MNQSRTARRRGMAMILVLVAVAVALVIGLSMAAVQATSAGVSRNIESHAVARMIAESGMEAAVTLTHRSEGNWREDYGEGTWASEQAYADGAFTVTAQAIEEGSGGWEPVLLEATGAYRGVTHTVRARLAIDDADDPEYIVDWIEGL